MRRSSPAPARRVTLLTDFGTADGYVAAMRGVIAAVDPDIMVDDATHAIAPGEVTSAAFVLARYARLYPPGTVHLVVVDPGVGTSRRALAAAAHDRIFVAPDNGVLTRVLADAPRRLIVALENPRYQRLPASATFHGRDIFAPAAAYLAAGTPLGDLGPEVRDPMMLELPEPMRDGLHVNGTVVHVDRFGNLVTNVPAEWLAPRARISIAGRDIGRVRRTYGDAATGEALALVGSDGSLEVAVRDGSAARLLNAGRGAEVIVTADA